MYANSLQVMQSSILCTFFNPGGPTIPRSSTFKGQKGHSCSPSSRFRSLELGIHRTKPLPVSPHVSSADCTAHHRVPRMYPDTAPTIRRMSILDICVACQLGLP